MEIDTSKINPIGIVSGILTLILPFAGYWWVFGVGELFTLSISPFDINIIVAGDKIGSPIFFWLTKGLTVTILIAGVSMIIGSISPNEWYGPVLINFGSFKVIILVIGTAVSMVLLLPSLADNLNKVIDIPFELDIPVQGESIVTFDEGNLSLKMKIVSKLTASFFFALFVGLTGVAARIYHMKMKRKQK